MSTMFKEKDILVVVQCQECSKTSPESDSCKYCQAKIPASAERCHIVKVRREDLLSGLYVEQKIITKNFVRRRLYRTDLDQSKYRNSDIQRVILLETNIYKRKNSESSNTILKNRRTVKPTDCVSSGEDKSKISKSDPSTSSNMLLNVRAIFSEEENSMTSEPGPSTRSYVSPELKALSTDGENSEIGEPGPSTRSYMSPDFKALSLDEENSEINKPGPSGSSNMSPGFKALSLDEENSKISKPGPSSSSKYLSLFAFRAREPRVKLFTYPPHSTTNGIEVTSYDLSLLNNERRLVNDVIIDFYMKYIFLEKLSPSYQEKTYFFDSVFYTELSKRQQHFEKDSNEVERVKRHKHVKRWTFDVDIFSKDYIIVPIFTNQHWYLAIICYPNRVPDAPNVPEKVADNVMLTDEQEHVNKVTDKELINNNEVDSVVESNSDIPMDVDSSLTKECEHSYSKEETEKPCICVFDSFYYPDRAESVFAFLWEYLEMEWKDKKGTPKVFDANTMKGIVACCPLQTNGWDCGLHVFQYLENFFENPIEILTQMPDLMDWFPEERIDKKRQELGDLILSIAKEKKNAPCEKERNAACEGEQNTACEDEQNAACAKEQNAAWEKEQNAACEKEQNAACEKKQNVACAEEQNAACEEEQNAACEEEQNAASEIQNQDKNQPTTVDMEQAGNE